MLAFKKNMDSHGLAVHGSFFIGYISQRNVLISLHPLSYVPIFLKLPCHMSGFSSMVIVFLSNFVSETSTPFSSTRRARNRNDSINRKPQYAGICQSQGFEGGSS